MQNKKSKIKNPACVSIPIRSGVVPLSKKSVADRQKSAGYTLIEIMVAVAIFFIIIASPTGFLVGSYRAQQKVFLSREIADSMSYALENMSRSIRMARKDDINGVDCLSGTEKINYEITTTGEGGIKFRNYKDECQEFYLEIGRIFEVRYPYGNPPSSPLPITASDIDIEKFNVYVSDNNQSNNIQPQITFSFKMEDVILQTTISQRNLDVAY